MMKINLQIGYDLQSLPRVNNFKFRGVTLDGDLEDCFTFFDGNNFEIRKVGTDDPIINDLRGCMQHLPKKLISEGFLYETKNGFGYETHLSCSGVIDRSGKIDIREVFSISKS